MGCASAKPGDVNESEQIQSSKTHSRNPSSASLSLTEVNKLYRRANYLIKNERFDEAIKLLDRIIETDPEFIDAYYSKGVIELHKRNLENAKKQFQLTLEKQPNHALALNEIASFLINEKKYNEALTYLENGFQINPNIPDLNYGLGYVLSRLERKEEAIRYYDMAIQQDKIQKHYYISKATALTDLKQFDRALESIQNALKIDSNYIDGYQAQAYVYNQQKQYDKLEQVCDTILKLNDENQFALKFKRKVQSNFQKQSQIQQAVMTVEDQMKEAQKLQEEQKHTEALNHLNQVLEKNSAHLQALKAKASIQIELKQQAGSLITLNQILSIDPNEINALKEKVKILEYMNKDEEALKCYDQILGKEKSFDIMEKKASILIKLNRIQEASEIYEYLYSQSSLDDPKIFIIRGKLLQAQKKYEDAITFLNDGITKFPSNIEILNLLALIYKITMKVQQELETYEKILVIQPQNELCLYEKGLIYYNDLGLILFNLNNFSESLEIFIQLNKSEYAKNLHYHLGICYNEKKEYFNTLNHLNQYVKSGKENLEKVYFIMGSANLFLLKFDESIESYQNCIKINPKNAEAHYQLGNVYKQDKLLDEAKESFEQAVKIQPQNNLYKQALDNLINEKSFLQEYRNSLLFTLITFIGCCQLDPKSQDFEKMQNQKYLTLLTLMEAHLKKRFNTLEKHFEQIKQLIGQSYDMKLTLIDDTLFPIMQFWHNQKICKKKKDNNDLVVSMINSVKSIINSNNEKILTLIQDEKSLNNRFCLEFLSKCQHESYQNMSGKIGLLDGIKILGFLIKYHKEFTSESKGFPEFIADKYLVGEITNFHDSYYQQNA
ncbi:unnamed protein product [Paramecium octaurelia]|uniref:Tetratricopeptide repeat protein n=1 Tax=Paramecium octaurelia TaxID=43137 RepID=A0A8S1WL14_PAROT|nr:unnamed protein product [Paramecium octaurelia]